MKKKLLIPFAVLAAFMGLSACGGNNQTESKAPGVSTSASEKNEIKITFSNANKKLTKGEKGTFTSTVEGVTWSSDNTAVATIDDKGEVTAVGEGKAVIKASKEGYKDATETITVVLKKIVVTAAGNKTALTIGEEVQLSADVTGVTWTTSDNKLATVDNTGKVKALAAGSVTISAEAEGYTKGSISLEIARPAANATFDFLTDADHYSADGWWELASTGFFSMETSEGFTPKMTPMSFGQQTEESDPYIGGFDVGDKETIKFNSNKANSAEFLVNIGNADEIALADVMSVKLNGVALDLSAITLPAHEGQYGNTLTFEDVSLGNATLINGENTLVFEFLASNAPRLNTLAVYAGDATVAVVAPVAKSQIAVNEAKLSVIEGEDVQIVTTEVHQYGPFGFGRLLSLCCFAEPRPLITPVKSMVSLLVSPTSPSPRPVCIPSASRSPSTQNRLLVRSSSKLKTPKKSKTAASLALPSTPMVLAALAVPATSSIAVASTSTPGRRATSPSPISGPSIALRPWASPLSAPLR